MKSVLGLIVLAWVNVYICREIFSLTYPAQLHLMEGALISIAHLGDWWGSVWWPYWNGGMPQEQTGPPLIPMLTALCALLGRISPAAAYHIVAGLFYCLAPLSLSYLYSPIVAA